MNSFKRNDSIGPFGWIVLTLCIAIPDSTLGGETSKTPENEKAPDSLLDTQSSREYYYDLGTGAGQSYRTSPRFAPIKISRPVFVPTSTSIQNLHAAGKSHLQRGELEQALELFTRAISIDPNYAPPRLIRIEIYLYKGKLQNAFEDCSYLIEHKLELKDAHTLRARCYNKVGFPFPAFQDAKRAMALDGSKPDEAYALAALSLLQLKQPINAYLHATRALELNPKNVLALLLHAMFSVRDNAFTQAIQDADALIEQIPNSYYPYLLRAYAMHRKGDRALAWEYLNKANRLAPFNKDVLVMCGIFRASDGKYSVAKRWFEEALRKHEDDIQARLLLSCSLALDPDHSPEDMKQAVHYAREACKLTKYEDLRCLLVLASICEVAEDAESANSANEKAAALLAKKNASRRDPLAQWVRSNQRKSPRSAQADPSEMLPSICESLWIENLVQNVTTGQAMPRGWDDSSVIRFE